MENGSTHGHSVSIVEGDAAHRTAPTTGGGDAPGPAVDFSPADVARRIFGPDAAGPPGLQPERPLDRGTRQQLAKAEREKVISLGTFLPQRGPLDPVNARGTEHLVQFWGEWVEKHQRTDGWAPILTARQQITLGPALPSEYLRRLHLQNELFGDVSRIVGLTSAARFALIQPALRGREPSEIEIRDLLTANGWLRIPMNLQDLPEVLMGSAWWNPEERLVLLDARKPNFVMTSLGLLPLDLVLGDLTPEVEALLTASAGA